MASDDQAVLISRPSLKLSKELHKILKHENRMVRSDGTISSFSSRDSFTKESEIHPRENVMSYDNYYEDRLRCIIRGRTYIPILSDHSQKFPIIVFFHGGGFVMHESAILKYDNFCRRLALELPCTVVSINCPHAPKRKCPAQYDKAFEYLKYFDTFWTTFEHGYLKSKKTDINSVFLAGDEAGGNIAHQLATGIATHEMKLKNFKIKGLISIQPLFGGEERTDSEIFLSKSLMLTLKQRDGMWKSFLPDHCDRDCEYVNVGGPNNRVRKLQGFPKTLLIVGGLDPLQDWQKRYHAWLKKCGVDATLVQYPKAIPQFYLHPNLLESTLLINDIRSFMCRSVTPAPSLQAPPTRYAYVHTGQTLLLAENIQPQRRLLLNEKNGKAGVLV